MNTFAISSCFPQDITILSNTFLDQYMPQANGEFVKVYLYLLRLTGAPDKEASLSSIADHLSCNESDVLRALTYWERAGILRLSFAGREIESVTFVNFCAPDAFGISAGNENTAAACGGQTGTSGVQAGLSGAQTVLSGAQAGLSCAQTVLSDAQAGFSGAQTALSGAQAGFSGAQTVPSAAQAASAGAVQPSVGLPNGSGISAASAASAASAVQPAAAARDSAPAPYTLTAARREELTKRDDITELFFIAEQYIGKPLSRSESEKILYFYDGLHFSAELIDYLIEYCVNRGHKSFRYIEKVALSWHDKHVTTVEEAQEESSSYHKEYYEIFRFLGISSHTPIEAETSMMDAWLSAFPMELIREACTRTILKTSRPTLKYVDGILKSWQKASVRTLEDIRRLDAEHGETVSARGAGGDASAAKSGGEMKTGSRSGKKSTGSFGAFSQRSYDFDELESTLLGGRKTEES